MYILVEFELVEFEKYVLVEFGKYLEATINCGY